MGSVGRGLIVLGIVLTLLGAGLLLAPRIPWLGRLPGDLVLRRRGFTLYFPLVTCIVVSVVVSVLLYLMQHFRR